MWKLEKSTNEIVLESSCSYSGSCRVVKGLETRIAKNIEHGIETGVI